MENIENEIIKENKELLLNYLLSETLKGEILNEIIYYCNENNIQIYNIYNDNYNENDINIIIKNNFKNTFKLLKELENELQENYNIIIDNNYNLNRNLIIFNILINIDYEK